MILMNFRTKLILSLKLGVTYTIPEVMSSSSDMGICIPFGRKCLPCVPS